jgi:hypothetical protein
MRPRGYLTIVDPDRPLVERDTITCAHCQRICEVKPGTMGQVYLIPDRRSPTGYREASGAYCGKCAAPLCLPCDDRGDCVPAEEMLRRWERR